MLLIQELLYSHAEQKRFEFSRNGYVETVQDPVMVVTAHGEIQTTEEAQAYVHDLGLFVTVQLLAETPAVLSLGKLCKEHGYSCDWVSGQKPRLTKEGKTSTCKIDNHVPLVAPGLSAHPGSSSSSKLSLRDQSSTDQLEEQHGSFWQRERPIPQNPQTK